MSVSTSQSKYTVEALDGYFAPKPESPKRDWKEPESFGLLLSGGWRELDEAITTLNRESAPNESYELLILSRHGLGVHNFFPDAWFPSAKCSYPIWDPYLSNKGLESAQNAGALLQDESRKGMPIPQKFFTSPSTRAGETLGEMWAWTVTPSISRDDDLGRGVKATALMRLLERGHGCDADLPPTYGIHASRFPSFIRPDDMPTKDPSRGARDPATAEDCLESEDAFQLRNRKAIEEVIDGSEGSPVVSVTGHGSALSEWVEVLTGRSVPFRPADIHMLVIKVTDNSATRSATSGEDFPEAPTGVADERL